MTKEERAEKWCRDIPQAKGLDAETCLLICNKVARWLAITFMLALVVEVVLYVSWGDGGVFTALGRILNDLMLPTHHVSRTRLVSVLVGTLLMLVVFLIPPLIIMVKVKEWLLTLFFKRTVSSIPAVSESPTTDLDHIRSFLRNPDTVDSLYKNNAVVMIDWREADEDIIDYFNDKLEEPVEANAEYGETITSLTLRRHGKTLWLPYFEDLKPEQLRNVTLKGLDRFLRPEAEIRLFTDTQGSDTPGFVLLTTIEWQQLEQEFGFDKVLSYFVPITFQGPLFSAEPQPIENKRRYKNTKTSVQYGFALVFADYLAGLCLIVSLIKDNQKQYIALVVFHTLITIFNYLAVRYLNRRAEQSTHSKPWEGAWVLVLGVLIGIPLLLMDDYSPAVQAIMGGAVHVAAVLTVVGLVPFIAYIAVCLIKDHLRERREKAEVERLRATLSPYDFYSTVLSAANQEFRFGCMESDDQVEVCKKFRDANGVWHEPGERFFFASVFFMPHDLVATLYISTDQVTVSTLPLLIGANELSPSASMDYFGVIYIPRFPEDDAPITDM